MSKTRESWRRPAIDEMKRTVKAELDQVLAASNEAARLNYILEQIQLLEEASEGSSHLRRFVLVMSALVHHERYGGLSKKQIQDLGALGQAILRVVGVKTGHTPTSFLYAEMHAIMSDIHYSNGEFLSSLWERQLGAHAAVMTAEHLSRQNYGMGLSALRLGNITSAVQCFEKALAEGEDQGHHDRIRMHLLKAKRLSGDREEAYAMITRCAAEMEDQACLNELKWEKALLDLASSQDLGELFALSKRGQPLHASSYLLELFLWTSAHAKTKWSEKIAKVSTLGSQRSLDFHRYTHLYAVAQNIEQAYDVEIPFAKRLLDIKKILPRIQLLRQVDQELLAWLSLARWLYRSHHYPMASMIFHEYQALCLKLSRGASRDVLGIAQDLAEVDWLSKSA